MDTERFDALSKTVSGRVVARRSVLGWLAGSLVGGALAVSESGSTSAHKKRGGKKHHRHHHRGNNHRCITSGGACTTPNESQCCSGTCGTQGNVVDKCCIPPGGPCDAGPCCNGNFGCRGTELGAFCI